MSPSSRQGRVGYPTKPVGGAPVDTPIWSEDWATAAAGKSAFFSAYASKWTAEPTTFNVGGANAQLLQAVWNTEESNVVVSAATSGGTGNSCKLQWVRADHTVPCSTGGTIVIPFSAGGINSRGDSGSGSESGPYRIQQGNIVEVRMRFTDLRNGHRGIAWQTSYNRNAAELDYPEFFSIAGNGGHSNCALNGSATTTQKRNHWSLFWNYNPTKSVHSESAFADTSWHIYQMEWKDRSIKMFQDGQLQVHYGDAPLDPRAVFAGYLGSRTEPFKWADQYQPDNTNANGYTYPAPFDSGNISKLKLSMEVGGRYCQPIDPTAYTASIGTVLAGTEIDYIAVYNVNTHGSL